MSDITPAFANALYAHFFHGVTYGPVTDLAVGLFVDATEVVGGSYSRVSCFGSGNWDTPVNGRGFNTNDIVFPTATADWGVITHFGIFDQDGLLCVYKKLIAPRTINNTDVFKFEAKHLTGTVGG